MNRNKSYAAIDKTTKAVVAIIDQLMLSWWETNFPMFECIELVTIGSTTASTPMGSVNALSCHTIDRQTLYLIQTYPEGVSLEQAYTWIKE